MENKTIAAAAVAGLLTGFLWAGLDKAPMFVTSLNYFSALVEEVGELSVGEDYWKHVQHKVVQLEGMWREFRPATNPKQETK
jgi:hypothetical protein